LKDRIMRVTFTPHIPLNPPSKGDFEEHPPKSPLQRGDFDDRIMRVTFAKDLGFMTLDVPTAPGFGIRFWILVQG